jgi:hypothetical protein
VDQWRSHGIRAAHIDGTTPAGERDAIIEGLDKREIQVVSNYAILTEGWDLPSCGACVLARPTMSLQLHLQMLGRVMRPDPADTTGARPIVLDHAGNIARHGFAETHRPPSLDGLAKKAPDGPPLRTCGECFAIFRVQRKCPACGHEHIPEASPRPTLVEVDGDMVEVDREAVLTHEERAYAKLVQIASDRNYKVGWARSQAMSIARATGLGGSGMPRDAAKVEQAHYMPFGFPVTMESVAELEARMLAQGVDMPPNDATKKVKGAPSWTATADRAKALVDAVAKHLEQRGRSANP